MATAFQPNAFQLGAFQIEVAVWPAPGDVKAGVQYGPTGVEYTGTLVITGAGEVVYATTFFVNVERREVSVSSRPGEVFAIDYGTPQSVDTLLGDAEAFIRSAVNSVIVNTAPAEVAVLIKVAK